MNRDAFEAALLEKLCLMWNPFTAKLPVKYDVAYALDALKEYSESHTPDFLKYATGLGSNVHFSPIMDKESGMNSPGILWDRLTILNCKLFFTSPDSPHFNPKLHNKKGDVRSELSSVLTALHDAKPPKHVLLAKEATERQSVAPEIGTSLWELQSSNLAMWINQDLLYTVNVDEVDSKRLRDYIKFFSEANRIRNTAIEHIELFYSQKTAS